MCIEDVEGSVGFTSPLKTIFFDSVSASKIENPDAPSESGFFLKESIPLWGA